MAVPSDIWNEFMAPLLIYIDIWGSSLSLSTLYNHIHQLRNGWSARLNYDRFWRKCREEWSEPIRSNWPVAADTVDNAIRSRLYSSGKKQRLKKRGEQAKECNGRICIRVGSCSTPFHLNQLVCITSKKERKKQNKKELLDLLCLWTTTLSNGLASCVVNSICFTWLVAV